MDGGEAGVTRIKFSIQPKEISGNCNPNGTQCRMLQCAIQAEHSRTEVSTLTVYVHCNSKNLFLVFVCDVFHVPLMNVA